MRSQNIAARLRRLSVALNLPALECSSDVRSVLLRETSLVASEEVDVVFVSLFRELLSSRLRVAALLARLSAAEVSGLVSVREELVLRVSRGVLLRRLLLLVEQVVGVSRLLLAQNRVRLSDLLKLIRIALVRVLR